jgi:hypothetical protein
VAIICIPISKRKLCTFWKTFYLEMVSMRSSNKWHCMSTNTMNSHKHRNTTELNIDIFALHTNEEFSTHTDKGMNTKAHGVGTPEAYSGASL